MDLNQHVTFLLYLQPCPRQKLRTENLAACLNTTRLSQSWENCQAAGSRGGPDSDSDGDGPAPGGPPGTVIPYAVAAAAAAWGY
eukprot:608625-Hanusia_phi.AAC.9